MGTHIPWSMLESTVIGLMNQAMYAKRGTPLVQIT